MAPLKAAKMPSLIYGTAWKKDDTKKLVKQAILSGFRGVDTAAQPKHYREDLVGEGIRDALHEGGLRREDLYVQTKFTAIHGQDPNNLPYSPKDTIVDQVQASVISSLRHLRDSEEPSPQESSYIDCLVLHSPYPFLAETKTAWRAMESFIPSPIRTLGISNIYQPDLLSHLYNFAKIKPSVVQNRFYAATGYDSEIRAFCAAKGIIYQSFWTLTANPRLLESDVVGCVANRSGVERAVALYALVLGLGQVSVLDGTTNAARMKDDLEGVQKARQYAENEPRAWERHMVEFKKLLMT